MSETTSASAADATPKRKMALVVDDVEDILDLMEIALEGANVCVLRATSAAEAIESFDHRTAEIDLLLTDARVGSDSGLELAKRFLAVKPSLKVLVTSGFPIHNRRLSEAGAAITFLAKPFSSSELRKKLHALFLADPIATAAEGRPLASLARTGFSPSRPSPQAA